MEVRAGAVKGCLVAGHVFAAFSFPSAPFLLTPNSGIFELQGSKLGMVPEQQGPREK